MSLKSPRSVPGVCHDSHVFAHAQRGVSDAKRMVYFVRLSADAERNNTFYQEAQLYRRDSARCETAIQGHSRSSVIVQIDALNSQ